MSPTSPVRPDEAMLPEQAPAQQASPPEREQAWPPEREQASPQERKKEKRASERAFALPATREIDPDAGVGTVRKLCISVAGWKVLGKAKSLPDSEELRRTNGASGNRGQWQ